MKTRTQFICELCETTYDDPAEALKCEKEHLEPVEILSCEYLPGGKYAKIINVKFLDGEVRSYVWR